jgi:capsid portal protein
MANEHNFATANVAMFAAESQVFAPERTEIDEILNNKLVFPRHGLRLKTVKLAGRTPAITSPEGQIKTMTALNVMGALTPRKAQKLANTMLQIEIDEYPPIGHKDWKEWMDQPMALSTGGAKTHDAQAQKDDATKETEKTGEIAAQPKHGEE